MGEIKYFLNKNKGTEENRPIMLSYHFNGQRLFYYTGKKAHEKQFDPTKKKPVTGGDDRLEINELLKTIRDTIGAIENKAKAGGAPVTAEMLRNGLNDTVKARPQKKEDIITLKKYFDIYLAEMPNKINLRTGRKLSKTMPQKYTNLRDTFIGFCKHDGKEYDFDDIDSTFYNKFVSFLINEKKYSVNTYGRAIKFFKTILYDAANKGINKNFAFVKSLQGITEQADSVYLTESELQSIHELNLTASPHLDRVRDLFLIGCWTGLRFSDFSEIKPEDIRENRIRVLTQKTKQRVTIPVNPVVKSILLKYNYELPPSISNQKFNDYIKDVVGKAEIKELYVKRITRLGVSEKTSKAKYEFVGTHTARRSFATNMFLRGVPSAIIMGITGHATEKEFLKYIKVNEEQKADMFEKFVNWQK
jgi:integrase